jgi:hypothetical protein
MPIVNDVSPLSYFSLCSLTFCRFPAKIAKRCASSSGVNSRLCVIYKMMMILIRFKIDRVIRAGKIIRKINQGNSKNTRMHRQILLLKPSPPHDNDLHFNHTLTSSKRLTLNSSHCCSAVLSSATATATKNRTKIRNFIVRTARLEC